jgi:hypothetical protein
MLSVINCNRKNSIHLGLRRYFYCYYFNSVLQKGRLDYTSNNLFKISVFTEFKNEALLDHITMQNFIKLASFQH